MSMELMNKAVKASMKSEPPVFGVGDTVKVSVRIVEGEKERIQAFAGTVIARRGSGIGNFPFAESSTMRRRAGFPVLAKIASIEWFAT